MTGGVLRLRFVRLALLIVAIIGALALFPLRLALSGMADRAQDISARSVSGSLWRGSVEDVHVGPFALGDAQAGLSPVPLLVGRSRFDLWRDGPPARAFKGAFTAGFNQRGIDDVTGTLLAGQAFAPLPITAMTFDDLTVHFANDRCSKAEGTVRIAFSGQFVGVNLSQGMAGPAICDGMALLLPLSSQTGLEKLSIRIRRDGQTEMQMSVRSGQGVDDAALAAFGFKRVGQDNVLNLSGPM